MNPNCNYFFKNSFKIKSDAFYINLDDDPNFIPEIYVGRITRNFLNIQWNTLNNIRAEIALPFYSYAYTPLCPDIGCKIREAYRGMNFAKFGEEFKQIAKFKNIETITLYEQRGDCIDKISSDLQLNKSNFENELNKSNIIIAASTGEPLEYNYKKTFFPTAYNNLTTSIWNDINKDGLVDNNQFNEITYETFFDFNSSVSPIKRIAIIPILDKPYSLDGFYNLITSIDKTHFNESLYKRNSAIQQPFEFSLLFLWDNPLWGSNIRTWDKIIWTETTKSFLYGSEISKSLQNSFSTYTFKQDNWDAENYGRYCASFISYLELNLFGPPETKISDLARVHLQNY